MDRKRTVPSIIEEVVIYDKPNKPEVPREIYSELTNVRPGKGDIVLSRARDEEPAPIKTEEEAEYAFEFEDEETEEEEAPEAHKSTVDSVNNLLQEYLDEDPAELEESIENISKEISKTSAQKRKWEKSKEPDKKLKTPSKENFKRPRGRPRKSESAPQKTTILNFLIKHPKPNDLLLEASIEPEDNSSDNGNVEVMNVSLETGDTRQKRTRRIPKKFTSDEVIVEENLGHYSNDEGPSSPSMKKKQYTELKVVNLQEADLEQLLDETDDQVRALNEAESELETFAKAEKPPKKPLKTAKETKKASRLQPKTPVSLVKPVKEEDKEDETEEEEEEEEEEDDASRGEAYDSDEDSRTEWVPEEYAEYKKQHTMKKTNSKPHKCKYCGLQFGTYYSVRKHRALEHDDVGKDRKESTYKASEGADEVQEGEEREGESDEESRGEWMPQDYAEYKMKHTMNKLKRAQWYKCKICCAIFSNYYKLSKHKLEHENKTDPYECKQCDSKFKDIDSLTAHIRVHQGKDPYKCNKCDKGFQIKEDLIAHLPIHVLKKAPPAVKRFRCDLCGKEFSKLCDIERHSRVHTGEKPCECNICHKRFQQSHNLSKHLLTHLHVKPFQCEICNKKFGRIDVLNRHILTHSMEKPFKCGLCGKGFIREVQLNNHMEKYHPDVDFQMVSCDSEEDEVSVTPIS